jgi:excisionase family DNA binding protein
MRDQLTIGETAKRLGLEVDTIRKLERTGKIKAIRTRGGHRRFTEEEIARFRKSRRKDSKSGTRRSRSIARRPRRGALTQGRHPETGEFLPRGVEIADDFDNFEDLPPSDDFDDELEPEVYLPRPAPPPPPPVAHAPQQLFPVRPAPVPAPPPPGARSAANRSFSDQLRLQTIKGHGKAAIPWNAPPEWQGKVIADLERFVTTTQFPDDLSYAKAAEIVRARVDEVLRPWREAEEKATRKKKAKEEADRRRIPLIAHGNNYAWRETTDWDWSASNEARDEVKKVLEREVEHDWTEREVEDAVDEVLDEWDDDDDEEWDDD